MFSKVPARFARSFPSALSKNRKRDRLTRLSVELMEDRSVPAVFNLTIDGDAATTASSATAAGVTTFTATATGQNVQVGDIKAALDAGNDVVINPGANNQITVDWLEDSTLDVLSYTTNTLRSLAINTAGGLLHFKSGFDLTHSLDVTFNTVGSVATGDITLDDPGNSFVSGIQKAHSISLDAGTVGTVTTNVTLSTGGSNLAGLSSGDVTIVGSSFTTSAGATISSGNDIDVNAQVNLGSAYLYFDSVHNLTLEKTVDGPGNLSISAGNDVKIEAAIGSGTPLDYIQLYSGNVTFAADLSAANIVIYGGTFGEDTSANGDSTVTGYVTMYSGTLAPGGVASIGTLNIVGNLDLQGGTVSVDFGHPKDDQIQISGAGNLNINGAILGDDQGIGIVTGPSSIFTFTGTLTGTFDNLQSSGDAIFQNGDVATIDYGIANKILVKPAPIVPNGVSGGVEVDGTAYTVTLTGGGQLVSGFDQNLGRYVVVRNSTATSQVNLKTAANASNNLAVFSLVAVDGPLKALNGGNIDVAEFRVGGAAKSITLHDLIGNMTLGGTATDSTTLTAKDIFGNVTAGSAFSKITIGQELVSRLTAASIGPIKADQVELSTIKATSGGIGSITTTHGFNADIQAKSVGAVKVGTSLNDSVWTVTNGIPSISAVSIFHINVTAKSLGSLSATGDKAGEIPGDISNSTFTLTGNDGTAKKYGLKTVTAKGSVFGTTFNVQAGNVDSVTVGRFIFSRLFLGYDPNVPAGSFNTGGSFTGAFKLNKFTVTATTNGNDGTLNNYAIHASQIVADTIGTMKLSGVDSKNFGTAFGIKFHTSAGKITVADSDAATAEGTLTASVTAIANDFFILKV